MSRQHTGQTMLEQVGLPDERRSHMQGGAIGPSGPGHAEYTPVELGRYQLVDSWTVWRPHYSIEHSRRFHPRDARSELSRSLASVD
jgi:hypothetical protein